MYFMKRFLRWNPLFSEMMSFGMKPFKIKDYKYRYINVSVQILTKSIE